jgi:hypothetical protein
MQGKKLLLATAVLAALSLSACGETAPETTNESIEAAPVETAATTEPVSTLIAEEITVAELQTAMASGELTAVAIVEHYLDRIQTLDGTTNSVLTPRLRARATACRAIERPLRPSTVPLEKSRSGVPWELHSFVLPARFCI